jgi:putative endonuclease
MKTEKRRKGDIGEDITCKYLENKGYRVVDRNYLKPWGEIDVVAEKANILSFIEVKTVTRENAVYNGVRPEENFHATKLKRLYRAIQTYLMDHKVPDSRLWQIDLVCVYLNFTTKKAHVELMENIVL